MRARAWVSLLGAAVLLGSACTFDTSGIVAARGNEDGAGPGDKLLPVVDGADTRVDGPPAADSPGPVKDSTVDQPVAHDSAVPGDTAPLPCGPKTCSGCCLGNVCTTGTSQQQCGSGGLACVDCGAKNQVCTTSQTCGPCTSSQQCAGENVCVQQACVAAYGRDYVVTVVSAKVKKKKWDSSSYDPDPYVQLQIDDSSSATYYSVTKWDSYEPVWDFATTVLIGKTTKVEIDIRDNDGGSNYDLIGQVVGHPVPLAHLKGGGHTYSSSTADLQQLVVKYEPK